MSVTVTVAAPDCDIVRIADAVPSTTATVWLFVLLNEKIPRFAVNVIKVAPVGAETTIGCDKPVTTMALLAGDVTAKTAAGAPTVYV